MLDILRTELTGYLCQVVAGIKAPSCMKLPTLLASTMSRADQTEIVMLPSVGKTSQTVSIRS